MVDEARREHLRRIGFQPGQSGNVAGRPAGAKQKIAEQIIKDVGEAWGRHGVATLDKLAVDDPGKFCQLAVGVLPKDVLVSIHSTRLPGGLTPDDWQMVMEILEAIREALPDAEAREPGDVLGLVLESVRAQTAKVIEP